MNLPWPNSTPRPSTIAFSVVAGLAAALALAAMHAALTQGAALARLAETAELARRIGLTDLALFTEARYTRHPSMADLHTPFQDHPISFEHFPSGTFVPYPEGLGSGVLSFVAEEPSR